MSDSSNEHNANWSLADWKNFQPMYTLQPVEGTRRHQLKVWVDIVHSWAADHKQWNVVLEDCPVFENASIARKLPWKGREAVAAALVSDGRAQIVSPGRLQLYPQQPTRLAASLYEWVSRNDMLNSVYTVYELHDESSASEDNPCRGVDSALIHKVLNILERDNKAEVFQGTTSHEDGVKFFPV